MLACRARAHVGSGGNVYIKRTSRGWLAAPLAPRICTVGAYSYVYATRRREEGTYTRDAFAIIILVDDSGFYDRQKS